MKRISEKDIAVTAAAAARNVKFVVSLETNLAQGVAAKLGRPNKATGIDVVLTEDTAEITIRLIIRHGCRIPDVALQVQKAVKDAVEMTTGYAVSAVHVSIQDVDFSQEKGSSGIPS